VGILKKRRRDSGDLEEKEETRKGEKTGERGEEGSDVTCSLELRGGTPYYGVATISWLLKFIGLFSRILSRL